jgi:hypothetical protein
MECNDYDSIRYDDLWWQVLPMVAVGMMDWKKAIYEIL